MKPNLTFSKLSTILLSVIVVGTSCQKSAVDVKPSTDNTASKTQKLNVTNNMIDASSSDEDNFDMITGNDDYADVAQGISARSANNGKTVTYSPSNKVYPYTKTIDYGTGWTGSDGITRSGKIMITYYDAAADAAGKYTYTTYDNYYVNGVLNEGSIQVNKIKNGTDQTVYLYIIHKTLSTADGDVKDYNTNAKWTVIDWNGGTQNAYQIDQQTVGNETYNGEESNNFKTSIDENNPIIKPFTCKRVQGVLIADIHLTHVDKGQPNELNETLDYGNGACDKIATLTVNGGEPQTITLPLQFWPLNL